MKQRAPYPLSNRQILKRHSMCSTTIVMRWIFKPVLKLKILALRSNPGPGHFVAVHAQQLVLIQVKDVSNPILTVISPLHYENVGDGTPVAVELSVKWFDAKITALCKAMA